MTSTAEATPGLDEAVYRFAKSKTEEIRASISEYRGKRRIDLRTFVATDNGMMATKKGISVAIEQLSELEECVRNLREAVGR